MLRNTSGFWIVVALVLSSSLITPSWGRANERVTEFNIPPQSLDSALLVFAEQADVQISVSTVAIAGMKTPGVVGRFTPSAALARLLDQTGLRFTTVGDRTYSVSQTGLGSARGGRALDREGESTMALAQGETAASSVMPSPSDPEAGTQDAVKGANKASNAENILDEVVVTGTHIRGVRPAGSNLITIDREEIDKSGLSTVADVLRLLPQNFGGGPSEDTTLGLEARTNAARSTTVNLRGLGAGATLVLVNGRRLAPGGGEGTYTDISSIPLSSIERIDVLPDGASAIYGSDAVGGVVNMIFRENYDGAETRLQGGAVTKGDLVEFQLGQVFGGRWSSGRALVSLEYYDRNRLLARDRKQYVSDLSPFGGDNFDTLEGNPGTIVIGAQSWAIPRGQDGTSLEAGDLTPGTGNLHNRYEHSEVLSDQERMSVLLNGKQKLGDRITASGDVLLSKRENLSSFAALTQPLTVPNTNPFYVNPTGGTAPITVMYGFEDDLGPQLIDVEVKTANGTLGGAVELVHGWQLATYVGYALEEVEQRTDGLLDQTALASALSDTNPATAFNPFGDSSNTPAATLAAIRANSFFETRSEVRTANLMADGALAHLSSGHVRLAVGADFRDQAFEFLSVRSDAPILTERTFDRRIKAAFAEIVVPLAGTVEGRPERTTLELSLAGRYEDYSDFGETVTPKIGLRWSPHSSVSMRASWGESFKAPNLPDLNEANNGTFIIPVPTGGGSAPVLLWFGKNADLQEETATTWTLGVDFQPDVIEGLTVGATYFDIQYEDRVNTLPFGAFLDDPLYAPLVDSNPTPERRAEVCARGTFIGNPADCTAAPIAAIVDFRVQNLAVTQTNGIDLMAAYAFDTTWGAWAIDVNATYLFEYANAVSRATPTVDVLDTAHNPLEFRTRSSLSWKRDGFGATASVNYAGGYTDTASQPNRSVGSWTTVDLQVSYVSTGAEGWFGDWQLALTAQNLFDEDPPFLNALFGPGYDPENADLTGRRISVQFQKRW